MPPLHPALVHFPLALLPIAAVAQIVRLFRPQSSAALLVRLNLWLGTLGIAAAVLSGQASIPPQLPPEALEPLRLHQQLGYAALLLYSGLALWELARGNRMSRWEALLYTAMHWLGCGVLGFIALLGGRLVYDLGVGVLGRG
jgi:uncharacterized membrane protein